MQGQLVKLENNTRSSSVHSILTVASVVSVQNTKFLRKCQNEIVTCFVFKVMVTGYVFVVSISVLIGV